MSSPSGQYALMSRLRRPSRTEVAWLSINVCLFIIAQVILRTVSNFWGWIFMAISSFGLLSLTVASSYKRLGEMIAKTPTGGDHMID